MDNKKSKKDIAVENSSLIADHIIEQSIVQLKAKKTFRGVGGILKPDLSILPLLFAGEDESSEITPEFFKRILTALKEEITTGRAIAAGISNEGTIELDGTKYSAMVIIIYHELLENEAVTYVMPYLLVPGREQQDSNEVVLFEESAHLEFNNM